MSEQDQDLRNMAEDDDVEGHKHSLKHALAQDDDEDDVEGHKHSLKHALAHDDDEDDVEGHKHSLGQAPGFSGAVNPDDDVRS